MSKAATKPAVKRASSVGSQYIQTASESRFSPLRDLTPEQLVMYIESFESGDFAWLDRTMRAMERRDDIWKVSAAKARNGSSRVPESATFAPAA